MAIISAPMIMGATAMVAPSAGTNSSGSVYIQASYENASDITDATAANSTCYSNATGSWVALAGTITSNLKATTGANITMTATLTSSLDSTIGKGTAINCTIGNATAFVGVAPVKALTFDSTAPVITLDVPQSRVHYGGTIDYKCNTADAIDTGLTTTFNVSHPSGDSPTSTTLSSSRSVYTAFTDANYKGTFTFRCSATDYTGNTGTSTDTVTVMEEGYAVNAGDESTTTGNNKGIWIVIAIIAIVMYSKRKK